MRMTPPTSCAFASYLLPNKLPTFTPAADRRNVTNAITAEADHIFCPIIANESPAASASMLVAMAIVNIVRNASGLPSDL